MDAPTDQENGGRVARNTTYLTLALIGQKILSSLYYFVIFRLVGPTNTGEYMSAISYIAVFAVLIDLGLTPAFIRATARDPIDGRRHFSIILTFKLFSSVIVGGLVFLSVYVLTVYGHSHPNYSYLWWAVGSMMLDSLTSTSYGFFRGLQKLEYESVGTVIHRVLVMIVGITGLVLKGPPIFTVIAVVAGSIGNFLFASYQLWRQELSWRWHWHWPTLRRLLVISFPFAVAALFTAVYSSSDSVLLTLFAKRREVGIYGFALKGIVMFNVLPAALVAAIYPAMSAAYISSREKLQMIFASAMRYVLIVAVPITVTVFFLAEDLVLIFGGSRVWFDAIFPLRILLISLPFLFLNFPVGYLLNASNRQTRNTVNIGITVVLNIALNLLFIKQFTYISVAVNSLVSSILLLGLGLIAVRNIIPLPIRMFFKTLGKTVLAGACVAVAGWLLLPHVHSTLSVLVAGSIMSMIYILSILALRLIAWSDLRPFLQRLRRS